MYYKKFKNHIFLFIALFGLFTTGFGQFNVKVGFNLHYGDFEKTNQIFRIYNTNNKNNLLENFSSIHTQYGIDLGIRYHFTQTLAIGGGYSSLFSSNKKATIQNGSTASTDEWRVSHRFAYLGLESNYSYWGFGCDIGYAKMIYQTNEVGLSNKQTVLNDKYLNARAFLTFFAKSGNNSFAIRPFYNFPLDDVDISKVNAKLNGTSGVDSFKESFSSFGISILFFNGEQVP